MWYGTKKVAEEMCKDLPPPLVIKPCKVPSCRQSTAAQVAAEDPEWEDGADQRMATGTFLEATSGGASQEASLAVLTSNNDNLNVQLIYYINFSGTLSLCWVVLGLGGHFLGNALFV